MDAREQAALAPLDVGLSARRQRPPDVNCPRSDRSPRASSRSSASSTSSASSPSRAASSAPSSGRCGCIQPCTIATSASVCDAARRRRSSGSDVRARAPANDRAERSSRARPRPSSVGRRRLRRRRARGELVEPRVPIERTAHASSTGRAAIDPGNATSVSSASCRSSASRTSGQACARDFVDRIRIERADLREHRLRQHAPHLHRARPPLLERRIVEIRVRIGVQDLVREDATAPACRRRRTRIAPSSMPLEHVDEAVEVHRLGQHVLHHFADERVIGNLDVAFDVLLTRGDVGEHRRQQIVGLQALDVDRHLLAAAEAEQRERAARVPAPARAEDRRGERRLLEHLAARSPGCRNRKTSASGKLCCSASAMLMPLSVAAACSSKLNDRQKRLRSARPQALLMRAPNGAWMTSCMPPPSSKNRSAMIVVLRRHRAEHGAAGDDVVDELLGAGASRGRTRSCSHATAAAAAGARRRRVLGLRVRRESADGLAHLGDVRRQLGRPRRRFAAPERNRRRRAVRVFDEHAARCRRAGSATTCCRAA